MLPNVPEAQFGGDESGFGRDAFQFQPPNNRGFELGEDQDDLFHSPARTISDPPPSPPSSSQTNRRRAVAESESHHFSTADLGHGSYSNSQSSDSTSVSYRNNSLPHISQRHDPLWRSRPPPSLSSFPRQSPDGPAQASISEGSRPFPSVALHTPPVSYAVEPPPSGRRPPRPVKSALISKSGARDRSKLQAATIAGLPIPGARTGVLAPLVMTTLWEEEMTICYSIICQAMHVGRRADNNMINCTKLLNLAGLSRGKRDSQLKAQPERQVVKQGTVQLKGVWLPFDRAFDLAKRHQIDQLVYPLFEPDLGPFLYLPQNVNRTFQLITAARQRQTSSQSEFDSLPPEERRRQEALDDLLNDMEQGLAMHSGKAHPGTVQPSFLPSTTPTPLDYAFTIEETPLTTSEIEGGLDPRPPLFKPQPPQWTRPEPVTQNYVHPTAPPPRPSFEHFQGRRHSSPHFLSFPPANDFTGYGVTRNATNRPCTATGIGSSPVYGSSGGVMETPFLYSAAPASSRAPECPSIPEGVVDPSFPPWKPAGGEQPSHGDSTSRVFDSDATHFAYEISARPSLESVAPSPASSSAGPAPPGPSVASSSYVPSGDAEWNHALLDSGISSWPFSNGGFVSADRGLPAHLHPSSYPAVSSSSGGYSAAPLRWTQNQYGIAVQDLPEPANETLLHPERHPPTAQNHGLRTAEPRIQTPLEVFANICSGADESTAAVVPRWDSSRQHHTPTPLEIFANICSGANASTTAGERQWDSTQQQQQQQQQQHGDEFGQPAARDGGWWKASEESRSYGFDGSVWTQRKEPVRDQAMPGLGRRYSAY